MTFVGRTRDEIRDTLLGYWQADYAAATPPQNLLISPGSDAYIRAAGLAAILEGLEAQAEATTRNMMPDTADTDALNRFGAVYDIPRESGERARLTLTVTSPTTVSGVKGIPAGTRMTAADGTLYNVDSTTVTFVASSGTMNVSAVNAGATTSSVGSVLTFVSTPADFNSTGTVTAVSFAGTDNEDDTSYAQRLLLFLRERPASGNRADWRAWVLSYTGTEIAEAYVYPVLQPAASPPGAGVELTPGCVTVVALGPAQGDSPTETRIVPLDDVATRTEGVPLNHVIEYIEGSRASDGTVTTTGTQLRPVTMFTSDYTVQSVEITHVNVTVQCTMTTANAFPWAGTMTVNGASDATHLVVDGDHTAKNNTTALVYMTTSLIRGGYEAVSLGIGSYNGGTNRTTWTVSSMLGAPIGGASVYPAPANWSALRTAAFAYFDALGPGNTTIPVRWPGEDTQGRVTFYRSAFAARMLSVSGVLSADVTAPVSDQTPTSKHLLNLGFFLVTA